MVISQGYAQPPDIIGQGVYTAGQKAEMINRLNRGEYSKLIEGSNSFNSNPDVGTFNWFHDVVREKLKDGSGHPGKWGSVIDYSPIYNRGALDSNKQLHNMNDAAVHAWLTNDASLGRKGNR